MKKLVTIIFLLPAVFLHAQDYGVRIAYIGNSITYGAGLQNPATQSYPAQVGDLLKEEFGDTCVTGNFGVSSRTMLKNGDYPIWNDPEFDQALAFKPNIVIIALGTNDSKNQNWDEFRGEFYDDYLSMVDTFKRINPYVEIFVCYPPPAFEIVWNIRDSVIVNGVIPVVDQIVAETGAELIDFYKPLKDSIHLFPDNIHPNLQGSAVMAQIVNERFVETDVIRQAERGLTFITHAESDRQYITGKDSVGTLSWTTINATAVYLDGTEVDINGTQEVDHTVGTTHTLIAEGEKYTDTLVYEFVLYTPDLDKINLDVAKKSFYTEDTVIISAIYFDQYGYSLNDTILDLQWKISLGKGSLFGQNENSVYYTSTVAGMTVISASHMELKGGITLMVSERDHTSLEHVAAPLPIEIFPNPFENHIAFRFNKAVAMEANLKIIDLQGKVCIHQIISMSETEAYNLDTNQLPEGIYLYELSWGENVLGGKLVKSDDF